MGSWRERPIFCRLWKRLDVHFFAGGCRAAGAASELIGFLPGAAVWPRRHNWCRPVANRGSDPAPRTRESVSSSFARWRTHARERGPIVHYRFNRSAIAPKPRNTQEWDMATKAEKIVAGLGGIENIVEVEGCITRLRTEVEDASLVDEAALKAAGAHGVVKMGTAIQVVIGTDADPVAADIEDMM
ncbi:PTS glucose/sucrose transporter subunit IIB [Streptomyces pathocidini]|uniref:PTS glucose/sucrose transporter subunit IIB n=1 Tax=Streptomyces pathocidini TaxID=1650571 RepID=UPI0033D038A1